MSVQFYLTRNREEEGKLPCPLVLYSKDAKHAYTCESTFGYVDATVIKSLNYIKRDTNYMLHKSPFVMFSAGNGNSHPVYALLEQCSARLRAPSAGKTRHENSARLNLGIIFAKLQPGIIMVYETLRNILAERNCDS